MKSPSTADGVEAEAARLRSQLVEIGADIRQHADPAAVLDAAKSSFQRRSQDVPAFLKSNATPLAMLVLGGTLGAVVTGLFSPPRRSPSAAVAAKTAVDSGTRAQPSVRLQIKAALISALGVGLGYGAGLFAPPTATEERLLGQPKAALSEKLDQFLQEHMRGVKQAALNMFGASRLSGTALLGLAMLAEALGTARARPKADAP